MSEPLRLTREQARRIAVRAQLLDAYRPLSLVEVIDQLTLVQIDPTTAIARSADLVAWSRLGSAYDPSDLVFALETERSLTEHVTFIRAMDDIGIHMAKEGNKAPQAIGRGLVALMPKLLAAMATIGTAAMLWVGGQIVLHGLDEYHIGGIGHWLHDTAHALGGGLPLAGLWEWLINAGGAGVFGLLLGGLIVGALHFLPGKKAAH